MIRWAKGQTPSCSASINTFVDGCQSVPFSVVCEWDPLRTLIAGATRARIRIPSAVSCYEQETIRRGIRHSPRDGCGRCSSFYDLIPARRQGKITMTRLRTRLGGERNKGVCSWPDGRSGKGMVRSYPYHSFGSHEHVLNDKPCAVSIDVYTVLCVSWLCSRIIHFQNFDRRD
jgi:hypothetical protein